MRLGLIATAAAVGAAALAAPALGQADSGSTFPIERKVAAGSKPGPVIYAYGYAWVLDTEKDLLTRVNPATGGKKGTRVPSGAVDLVAGYNRIWVLSSNRTVARVTALTRANAKSGKTISVRFPPSPNPRSVQRTANTIRAGAGGVWVAGVMNASRLAKINPSTRKATVRRFPRPAAFTVEKNQLWLVSPDGSKFQRRSPTTLKLTRSINVLSATGGVTGALWIGYASGLFYLSQSTPNDIGEINAVSPTSGVIEDAQWNSDIALSCTATTGSGIWAAKGYDDLSDSPASVTLLANRTLDVLASESPFPPGSGNGAVECIAVGGGYVWVTDGERFLYQLNPSS